MSNLLNPRSVRGRPARSGVKYGWRKRARMAAQFEFIRKQRLFEAAIVKHS